MQNIARVTLCKLFGYSRHALNVDDDDAVQLKYVPLDFINFHVCSTLLPLIRMGNSIDFFNWEIYKATIEYARQWYTCYAVALH